AWCGDVAPLAPAPMLPKLDLLPVDGGMPCHLDHHPVIRNLHGFCLGEQCPAVLVFLTPPTPPAHTNLPTPLHSCGGPCPCLTRDFPACRFTLRRKVQADLAMLSNDVGITINPQLRDILHGKKGPNPSTTEDTQLIRIELQTPERMEFIEDKRDV